MEQLNKFYLNSAESYLILDYREKLKKEKHNKKKGFFRKYVFNRYLFIDTKVAFLRESMKFAFYYFLLKDLIK